jgi:hypothetical protein
MTRSRPSSCKLQIDMAYSITLAHSRKLISDAQRDEWFTLVSSVGLSMDHDLFDLMASVALAMSSSSKRSWSMERPTEETRVNHSSR